jgi:hypothetical protein
MANPTRRKFLKSAAVIAGSSTLASITGCIPKLGTESGASGTMISPLKGIKRENIKITDIRVKLLSYLLKPEELWTDGDDNGIIWQTSSVIIEVLTDAGIPV